MLKHYLKTALRHILRQKMYAVINVMGLALGICACIVIYCVTSYEFSFDKFHPDGDRIYCFDPGMPNSTDEHDHWNSVPMPMPEAVRHELTGFESVAAFLHYNANVSIPNGKGQPKKFNGHGSIIAEPQFFNIFSYTWLAGSPATALTSPKTVVLTQSRAREYFGDLPADKLIGKTVVYDDSLAVTVTGILKDWTENSDVSYTDFISYSTVQSSFLKNEFDLTDWFRLSHGSQAFVKLAKGVKPGHVNAQLVGFTKKHLDPQPGFAVVLRPLANIHFHREYGGEARKGNLPVLYFLMGIAIFILAIAAINFINLSTAQALQRAKETGIRKVFGSGKKHIIQQFLTETLLLTAIAALLAMLLVKPVMAAFAQYVPDGVAFSITNGQTWLFLAVLTFITTLLAGYYPAKVLSASLPITSLRGSAQKGSQKWYLRKSLVVAQFAISLVFIIATLVTGRQVAYMRTKDLGFKTDAIITLPSVWDDKTGKTKVLAEQIKQLRGVGSVIHQAFPPMGFAHMGSGLQLKGSSQKPFEVSVHAGNEDFVPFYGMKIIAGRNLLHSDTVREFLINETCAKALGFVDPQKAVGQLLVVGGSSNALPVAGVLADFNENNFHMQISPVIIENNPAVENGIAIKLATKGMQAGQLKAFIAQIENMWKGYFPQRPFEYSFLDDYIALLYQMDLQTEWLMNTSMLVTIFISCIGLFGLAMFTVQKRTKEIGIRKVLGAGTARILLMLNREIAVLIIIALLIASPVGLFLTNMWLQSFAYRTNVGFLTFIQAGAWALFIALLTVSFQSIKAATTKPVTSLRTE